jgi:hypothetical protein
MTGGSNKSPAAERTKIGRDRLRETLANAAPKVWNFSVDGHKLGECPPSALMRQIQGFEEGRISGSS